jgi:hypothetical protein
VAKKGDLKPVMHVNIGLDAPLTKALLNAAFRNERKITQEVRYILREHYGIHQPPAEEPAGVSA